MPFCGSTKKSYRSSSSERTSFSFVRQLKRSSRKKVVLQTVVLALSPPLARKNVSRRKRRSGKRICVQYQLLRGGDLQPLPLNTLKKIRILQIPLQPPLIRKEKRTTKPMLKKLLRRSSPIWQEVQRRGGELLWVLVCKRRRKNKNKRKIKLS